VDAEALSLYVQEMADFLVEPPGQPAVNGELKRSAERMKAEARAKSAFSL
jgi:hypothetical protein